MPRSPLWIALVCLLDAPALPADEPAAREILQGQGLKLVGSTYVLEAEPEILKGFTAVQKLQREHAQAVAFGRAFERRATEGKTTIVGLTRQRLQLNGQMQRLRQAGALAQYNQLVPLYNELTDRINLLQAGTSDPKALQNVREQVARRREAFVQALVELRPRIDALTKNYAEISQNAQILSALEELNRTARSRLTLGPSRAFQGNLKSFEKAEATLLTETIPLRAEGKVHVVDVTLNGQVVEPMVLDTGAGLVSVPAELAARAGVLLQPNAPRVLVSVADGRQFEALPGWLNSVRVGKFTVERVECIVLPAEFANAPALLGGSFLRHFIVRISPEARTLQLSRVSETAEGSSSPGGRPETPDRGR
jgi:aspartyl protease family protein